MWLWLNLLIGGFLGVVFGWLFGGRLDRERYHELRRESSRWVARYEKGIEKAHLERDTVAEQLTATKTRFAKLLQKARELEKRLKDQNSRPDTRAEDIAQVAEQLSNAEETVARLQSSLEQSQSREAESVDAAERAGSEHARLEEQLAELLEQDEERTAQIQELQATIRDLEEREPEEHEQGQELEDAQTRIKALEEELEELRDSSQRGRSDIAEDSDSELAEREAAAREALEEKVAQLESLGRELDEQRQKSSLLEEEVKALGDQLAAAESHREAPVAEASADGGPHLREMLGEREARITQLLEEVELAEERAEAAQEQVSVVEALREELRLKDGELESLSGAHDVAIGERDAIIERIRGELEQLTVSNGAGSSDDSGSVDDSESTEETPSPKRPSQKRKTRKKKTAAKKPADPEPDPETGDLELGDLEADAEAGAEEIPRDGPPDDLTAIFGIGPAIQKRLMALDIRTYRQIAAWKSSDIEHIAVEVGTHAKRIQRERWVERAQVLASQGAHS